MSDVATNGLLTISMITNESLMVLENTLVFAKNVNREYDEAFGKVGGKIGTTLNIRRPVQYLGRTGPALQVEGSVETTVPLVMTTQRGVDASWSSAELALDVDDFSERFIKPMVANVANGIDYDGCLQAKNIYSTVGVAGSPITSVAIPMQAKTKLDLLSAPRDNMRAAILDPASESNLAGGLTNLFNPSKDISDQYKDGTMGRLAGFKFSMDQNIVQQVFGPGGGVPVVSGAGQGSSGPAVVENSSSNPFGPGSLVTGGWTESTLVMNAGDVFTIAGVYAVNPQSRQTTGQLAQFVVVAPVTSSAGGAATIVMSPALYTSGQYQNVTGSPANGAALSLFATSVSSPMSLAFHKDAFTFASCDLQLPRGVDMAARVSDKKIGMSIRMVRAYDINNDVFPTRLDILYGWATLRPELACRMQS